MKLTLHRRGAETAERDAECQPSLRWSQRSLRLRGELRIKEVIFLFPKYRQAEPEIDCGQCRLHSGHFISRLSVP